MSDTITVRVHRISGYEPGQEVEIEVDRDGTPLEKFWRRRLSDAKRDECCEVVADDTVEEPQVEEPEEEELES